MTDFFALDVETANGFLGSICQIGIVAFQGGQVVDVVEQLIDPVDWFDPCNVAIHGIGPEHVAGQPAFADAWPALQSLLGAATVVHHTHFDRVALAQACAASGLPPLACDWLDSARIARRTWPDVSKSGYGLANLAERLDIGFTHHAAAEDARAAGLVVLQAIAESGISLSDWQQRASLPITPQGRAAIRSDAIADGPLSGEVVVFTGRLARPRREVAQIALALGAAVDDLVNKRTTMLVVGDQDLHKLAGNDKSAKHRKAEAMIVKGEPIRILAERDFLAF